jgi:hypothetical protein
LVAEPIEAHNPLILKRGIAGQASNDSTGKKNRRSELDSESLNKTVLTAPNKN